MSDYRVEEWTEDRIAEQKAKFPASEPTRFAVVEGEDYGDVSNYMVIGFFGDRAEADAFLVTLERQDMISASFIAWVRDAKERFVSDYDEIRKVVRAEL